VLHLLIELGFRIFVHKKRYGFKRLKKELELEEGINKNEGYQTRQT
jgi:hypothetical protein